MVDGLQFFNQYRLSILDVAESDGAFTEKPLSYLSVDKSLNHAAYRLFRVVGQRARGSLYGVCHHEASLFASERIGAGIGKQQVVNGLVRVFVVVVHVEVFGLSQSVVC